MIPGPESVASMRHAKHAVAFSDGMRRSALPRFVIPQIDRVRMSGRVERLPKDWLAVISFLVLARRTAR